MKLIILAFCVSWAFAIVWVTSLCIAAKRGDEILSGGTLHKSDPPSAHFSRVMQLHRSRRNFKRHTLIKWLAFHHAIK